MVSINNRIGLNELNLWNSRLFLLKMNLVNRVYPQYSSVCHWQFIGELSMSIWMESAYHIDQLLRTFAIVHRNMQHALNSFISACSVRNPAANWMTYCWAVPFTNSTKRANLKKFIDNSQRHVDVYHIRIRMKKKIKAHRLRILRWIFIAYKRNGYFICATYEDSHDSM